MVEFARRAIKAAGRHVEYADEFELSEFVSLRDDLDEVIQRAVNGYRTSAGRSWADVGEALGITRQAAQQRYAEKVPA